MTVNIELNKKQYCPVELMIELTRYGYYLYIAALYFQEKMPFKK